MHAIFVTAKNDAGDNFIITSCCCIHTMPRCSLVCPFYTGLGTVYAINTVLAIVSIFKAQERGQPVPLWVTKTFLVGGLAYDQLTQLPTTAEIERVQAVKGARALKNQKR